MHMLGVFCGTAIRLMPAPFALLFGFAEYNKAAYSTMWWLFLLNGILFLVMAGLLLLNARGRESFWVVVGGLVAVLLARVFVGEIESEKTAALWVMGALAGYVLFNVLFYVLVALCEEKPIVGYIAGRLALPSFFLILAVGFLVGKYPTIKDWNSARLEQKTATKAARIAQVQEQKEEKKRSKAIESFALAEASATWRAYQELEGVITDQSAKLADLRQDMEFFGKAPLIDPSFQKLEKDLAELKELKGKIHETLVDAYIAKCKCDTAPGSIDAERLSGQVREGLSEAEAAARRFREMRGDK